METKIPFNRPFVVGEELYYMAQSVMSGHTAPGGGFSEKCCELLSRKVDAGAVLLTTSCTAALEVSAMLCDIEPGDEVVLPSYTFVSTANAFCKYGAIPKFVDIRPDTLNIDESMVEALITPRTKAIVPVHYAGVPCEMGPLLELAQKHETHLVEDAAQALGSTYRGEPVGAIGDFGALSFHETKNFICGEGGALLLRSAVASGRAEMLIEEGTNRQQHLRGEVAYYEWRDKGNSLALPDLLAAFLLAQLEHAETITAKRRALHQQYIERLSDLEKRGLVVLPTVPDHCQTNFHLFYVLLESLDVRTQVIAHLRSRGIQSVFHYVPLHTSAVGENYGYRHGQLPVTESISDRLLRLPMFYELSSDEIDRVSAALHEFFGVNES